MQSVGYIVGPIHYLCLYSLLVARLTELASQNLSRKLEIFGFRTVDTPLFVPIYAVVFVPLCGRE
jgi:hypothetical protein